MVTVHGRSRYKLYNFYCGPDFESYLGRSREQRYTRLADWEYVGSCVKAADPMPIFGNGDIMSFEDYEKDIEQSGVSGKFDIFSHSCDCIAQFIFTDRRHYSKRGSY